MFNNHVQILLATMLMVLCTSCASVYVPNASHTHLLDQKGEAHAAVHTGVNGVDLQGAYAVLDNMGIVAAASFASNDNEQSQGDDSHRHKYGELGVSYYNSLGRIGRFEAMAGTGFGSAEAMTQYEFFGPNEVRATGTYNKLFAQSNIGLETGAFETGLALRLSQVTFSKFETSRSTYNESESGTFFEPALFGRLGWKNIKIESQLGLSGPLQEDIAFDYRLLFFSLGLHFQLSNL